MNVVKYDLIVLGSGGGLKIAMAAAQRGLETALVEARALGGTCLNRGCIPSKMLIYPADLLRIIERAGRINLRIPDGPQADFPALVQRVNEKITAMSAAIGERLQALPHLDLVHGRARFTGPRTVEVDGRRLTAPRLCIATGSRPAIPPLPGLDAVPYMTSEQALRRESLPADMIVLGAGYIACELGHAYGAYGTKTHFIVRSMCLRREDAEIREVFESAFGRHHTLHHGYVPLKVCPRKRAPGVEVTLRHSYEGHERTLEAEALLVATGVVPDTDGLNLESTDIARDPATGTIRVDETLQTTMPGIYALGDCIGRYLYRHAVNYEAEYLVRRLLDDAPGPLRYPPMPGAVFAEPEVASVGLTEEAARQQGLEFLVGRAQMADSNMGLARGLDTGLVKILVEKQSRRLLGVHIVGEDAATLIHAPLAILSMGGTLDDLLGMIYIHPAFPEVIRDAARDAAAAR